MIAPMDKALETIETLLRKYGHVYQANLAEIARTRWAQDPNDACRAVNNADWWDDRDSIAAVDLALDGGFSAQARADGQALRQALIRVYEYMQAYGQHNAEAELMVSQFNKWLTSHI